MIWTTVGLDSGAIVSANESVSVYTCTYDYCTYVLLFRIQAQKSNMKVAIALLPVLALACYAAPDVYIPWPQSEIQERNYYPSFGPVQEQGM